MAATETKKRETNFNRSYTLRAAVAATMDGDTETSPAQPATVLAEVSHEDAVIGSLDLSRVPQEVKDKAAIRYLTDGIVGAGNAALKAEGGTIESAMEKMQAAIDAAYDGSWKFRAASGESGLSTEEEHNVIAGELVALGKFPEVAPALAWVQGVYAKVKPQTRKAKDGTEKTVDTRPDYNKLKNVAQIRAAIAKAQPAGTESDLDSLLKG